MLSTQISIFLLSCETYDIAEIDRVMLALRAHRNQFDVGVKNPPLEKSWVFSTAKLNPQCYTNMTEEKLEN